MTSIYGSKKENRCTFVLQSSPSNMSSHNALISMSRRHRLPFCPDPSQQPSILITHSYRKLFAAICTLSASHVTILVALGGGGKMGENLQLLLLPAWKEWWRFVKRVSSTLQLACCVFIRSAVDFIAAVMLATVVIAVGWVFLSTLELKSRATRTWTWHVPRWQSKCLMRMIAVTTFSFCEYWWWVGCLCRTVCVFSYRGKEDKGESYWLGTIFQTRSRQPQQAGHTLRFPSQWSTGHCGPSSSIPPTLPLSAPAWRLLSHLVKGHLLHTSPPP